MGHFLLFRFRTLSGVEGWARKENESKYNNISTLDRKSLSRPLGADVNFLSSNSG
jgi:hypothetical protein